MTEDASTNAPPVVWKHIGLHGHSVGTFTASPSRGIIWKSGAGDEAENLTEKHVSPKHVSGAQWTVFGRNGHVRIQTSGKQHHELRLDGFPPHDFDALKRVFREFFNVELTKHTMSTSGTSFGNSNVKDRRLVFSRCILEDANEEGEEFEARSGPELCSLDLTEVSQCVLPGNNRNEIELQFPESDTLEAGTDQLVAIRFYVPPDPTWEPSDRTEPSKAEEFQAKIMKTANIKNTTGDVLVEFDESKGTFLTPRGRYTIELYDVFLRMRGNKYDYKIKYDDISRLFLLPKPDDVHMAFVIALDKPIRQGQQRYQHLVLQTTKEQSTVTVNLTDDELQKEYDGDLQPTMVGSLSNLIAKTFKVICRKKVFIPGKFANAHQQPCVKCALRANEGHLYPLEKQFIFIHKPPVLIRFEQVESVEFQRYAGGQGSTRNFDLCVTLKQGATSSATQKEYVFSGIDRSDYAGLYNFLSGKRIRIKNLQQDLPVEPSAATTTNVPMYDEDDEDESGSEDEDYDDEAAAQDEQGGSSDDDSDASSSMDDDALGSEIDDDQDSDLEDARRAAGISSQKKKKKRPLAQDKDDSPKKKRAKKKKKDPNAPKRAMSAYMLFSNAKRAEIKEKNPDATFGELARLVSAAFKALSEDDAQEWNDKAEQDKQRYKEEIANYSAPSSSEDSNDDSDDDDDSSEDDKRSKKKKDPNAPKKARSAYTFFMAEQREKIKEKNPDATFGELSKLVGTEFKQLSSEERSKWDDMAAKDKERYKEEMEHYTPPKKSDTKKKKKAKKDPNAPKRALTAFMYYSSAMRPKLKEENPDMSFGDLGKRIGEMYKNLTHEEKSEYEAKAEEDKQRYKNEMEQYKKKKDAEEAAAVAAAAADDSDDDDDSSEVPSDDDDDDDSD